MVVKIPESIYLLGEANGISRNTLRARVRKSGWELYKAATHPIMTQSEASELANKERRKFTEEEQARLKALGISRNLVTERVNALGWSMEEATSTPPLTYQEAGRRGTAVRHYGAPSRVPEKRQKRKASTATIERDLTKEQYRKERIRLLEKLNAAKTEKEKQEIGTQFLNLSKRVIR